jgi:hypothetical protein
MILRHVRMDVTMWLVDWTSKQIVSDCAIDGLESRSRGVYYYYYATVSMMWSGFRLCYSNFSNVLDW